MKTNFKTLFEVKLFHEFYQTDRNGKNVFELANQIDRLEFLKNKFLENDDNINQDLEFKIPKFFKNQMENFGLKLIPTYSGFKILISVKAKKLPSAITTYEPFNKLPNELLIPVLLSLKGSKINYVTNKKMDVELRSYPLFTNDSTITGARFFPFLTADIQAYDAANSYEQGEIAKFAVNDYKAFFRDHADAIQWKEVSGIAFANENDKALIPRNANYTFPKSLNIVKADFLLKDYNGTIVQEFHFKNSSPFQKVNLSFDPLKIKTIASNEPEEKHIYSLIVSATSGYSKNYKIVFYEDDQEIKSSLGLVLIKVKSSINNYKLLDNSGKLITRKNSENRMDPPAPVFELNFNSTPTFWRYSNDKGKDLLGGLYTDFLETINGYLVSKEPKPLTSNATFYRKPDNTLFFLPCPNDSNILRIENNKIYSDIKVPESTLFPIAP